MKKIPSHIRLPEIHTEGLTFEVSADLNLAANPLVFVKTRSSDRFLSQSFTLTTNGLEEVSESLWDMAKEIDEKYEVYWEKKKD